MPRRDQISDDKKQRLQQEQERLQKLMFDARSSVRRSSLKGHNDMNRLYPPLGDRPDTTGDDDAADQPEPVNVLWPKLNTKQQAVTEQPEEPSTQESPLTEKDLFPAAAFLNDDVKEEPPQEIVNEIKAEKKLLTEEDLFPETNAATDLSQQPRRSIIKVILPEQNVATAVVQPTARPAEERPVRETTREDVPAFQEARIEQIEEEEPVVYETQRTTQYRKRSRAGSYIAMLAAALLVGFGGYYFYYKSQPDMSLAERRPEPISVPASQTPVPPVTDSVTARNETVATPEPVKPDNTEIKEEPLKEPPAKATAKPPVTEKEKTPASVPASNGNLGQYKVISKAYFHNEPDESTRRKAFIIHWNNAVLTPLEEKQGFVYIVFTNHLGQTSKGWLRKKDLRLLN